MCRISFKETLFRWICFKIEADSKMKYSQVGEFLQNLWWNKFITTNESKLFH